LHKAFWIPDKKQGIKKVSLKESERWCELRKLNIGIVAHVDAGKTTLTENILYLGGVIHKIGRVDSGDTQTDSMDVERRRGISVKSTAISFYRNGVKFNLIDTPGHVDFITEVERSLNVLDGVILLISAKEGIQSQTRVLMDIIKSLQMPAVIFINKIDQRGAEIERITNEVNEYTNGKTIQTECVLAENENGQVHVEPLIKEKQIEFNKEILYSLDDELLQRYVENKPVSYEMFFEKLITYTRRGKLYPIFYGSALNGIGVEYLLNMLPTYLPESLGNIHAPVSGIVFKVDNSTGQKRSYIRLYQGCVQIRRMLAYSRQGYSKEEKITRISRLINGKIYNDSTIEAGDIGILYCKEMRSGDILGEPNESIKSIHLGHPTIIVEVKPDKSENKRELYESLMLLADEDPMLDVSVGSDAIGNNISLRLFGEVQMEILHEVLLEQFGIPVSFSEAITLHMETPLSIASAHANIGKGHPFRAGVGLSIEPLPRGSGIQYLASGETNNLEITFKRAVEEAVYESCKHGVYGWEITDAKIVFDFYEYCSVTGTPSDYRNLTPLILMEACHNAGMGLLEPVFDFELLVPENSASKAMYDCERMQAVIYSAQVEKNGFMITGIIPADTCKGYSAKLASYTEGKGMFLTRYHGYRNTVFKQTKVNESQVNLATNKALYLMSKLRAL